MCWVLFALTLGLITSAWSPTVPVTLGYPIIGDLCLFPPDTFPPRGLETEKLATFSSRTSSVPMAFTRRCSVEGMSVGGRLLDQDQLRQIASQKTSCRSGCSYDSDTSELSLANNLPTLSLPDDRRHLIAQQSPSNLDTRRLWNPSSLLPWHHAPAESFASAAAKAAETKESDSDGPRRG